MKNEIREMLKNAIQENAVSFKDNTSKVIYSKIAGRLEEAYKTTAKKLFTVNEEQKGIKLSIIDKIEGSAFNQSGRGAKFFAKGNDGKKYTFWSAGEWAWDNEDPSLSHLPKTFEVDTANPKHGIEDLELAEE